MLLAFSRFAISSLIGSTALATSLVFAVPTSLTADQAGTDLSVSKTDTIAENIYNAADRYMKSIDEVNTSLTLFLDLTEEAVRNGDKYSLSYHMIRNAKNGMASHRRTINKITKNPTVKVLGTAGSAINIGGAAKNWIVDVGKAKIDGREMTFSQHAANGVELAKAVVSTNFVGGLAVDFVVDPVEQIFDQIRKKQIYEQGEYEALASLVDLATSSDYKEYYVRKQNFSNVNSIEDAKNASASAQRAYRERLISVQKELGDMVSRIKYEHVDDCGWLCSAIGGKVDDISYQNFFALSVSQIASILSANDLATEFDTISYAYAAQAVDDRAQVAGKRLNQNAEGLSEAFAIADDLVLQIERDDRSATIFTDMDIQEIEAKPLTKSAPEEAFTEEFVFLSNNLADENAVSLAEQATPPDDGSTGNPNVDGSDGALNRPTAEDVAAAERLKQERLEAARLEAERLAQLRLMRISQLEAERDSLSLTQQDAAARYKERDNRLTILRFEELPKVEAISGPVRDRIAALRTEQSTTGLIASDQQLLLDLVAYEGVLQSEQERIARGISQAQAAIARYEVTLADVGARLEANAANLAGPDYNIEDDYTPPTFVAEGLTDWTGYSYEIPAFNATKPMESTLSNVIGHAVSIPAINGVGRAEVDLVAEDNTILDQGIPGAIVELEGESSRSLDGFAHLYFGDGIDEHGDESQWIYGQASTPEEFALRSGTATFNGGVLGYYAAGTATDYTLYPESVFGELELNIDFGTKLLTGEGRIEVDNEAANYTTELSLKEAAIAEKGTGLTRSLGFDARASLDNGRSADGNFVGTLYGSDTSEAAGSFALKLPGGFAAGVWAVGENYVPGEGSEEDGFSGAFVLGYSASETGHGTFWQDVSDIYEGKITFPGGNSGEDTQVNIATTFAAEGYSHVSWGTWVSTGATPSLFSDAGLWVDVDNVTNSISLQNRSGVAQYGGEIRGGYAGQGGVEEEATGLINITADFSEQSVGGQFQFGRSCSGAGLNGCAVATEVNTFDEPINDYSGSGFGNHGRVGMSGVIGVFGGANGQEVGGHAWVVADQGQYVGVFRAREGLSFGDFVTPTVTDAGGVAEGGSGNTSTGDGGFGFTDEPEYENYRGFSAYDGTLISGAEYVLGTVAATSVSDKGVVAFQNTDVTVDASGKYADPKGNEYSYVAWGQWDFEMNGAVAEVDGELVANSRANWLVYDPTTNLQQTGTATYTGAAFGEGTGMAAGRVRGDISLTADFAKDNVTGNMNLKDNNGASWANSTFDAPIRRDADSSGFQGDLSGSNVSSGGIFGGFAGPNAEEVGGGWQIDHVNGSSANGIFRAQN